MKTHYFIPIATMTLTLLMGGCTKEQDPALQNSNLIPESTSQTTTIITPKLKEVNLGTSGNFVILTKYGIREPMPGSAITGNIGTSPLCGEGIHVVCPEVTGNIYITPGAGPWPCAITDPDRLSTAVNDMETAYDYTASLMGPNYTNYYNGDIGDKLFRPGLYKWTSSLDIPTNITLYGGPNDVFIFQIAGSLTLDSKVNIVLKGGAQSSNIFWQTDGDVTLGDDSHFEGILLCKTSVNLNPGASVNGRLLAQYEVVLHHNVVKQPIDYLTQSTE